MKKLFTAVLMCFAVAAGAQTINTNPMVPVNSRSNAQTLVSTYKMVNGYVNKKTNGRDTMSAADTSYLYFYSQNTANLTLNCAFTKISGYTRLKTKLQGTTDTTGDRLGTANWYTIRGLVNQCAGCSDSTYNVTNASGNTVFSIPSSPMNAYRLQIINDTSAAGTSVSTADLYYKK